MQWKRSSEASFSISDSRLLELDWQHNIHGHGNERGITVVELESKY